MAENTGNVTRAQLEALRRQKAYAWAQYYSVVHDRHMNDYTHYRTLTRNLETAEIPVHIKDEFKEMAKELRKTWDCPICLEFIQPDTLEITSCGHFYCRVCLERLKAVPQGEVARCPVCRRKL